jgi:hypothetical protein
VNAQANHTRLVYIGLIGATLLALVFSTNGVQNLLSARGAAAAAAVIAFIKVRYVALDFMELRGTVMQKAFDAWILLVGGMSVALMLR